MQGALKRQQFNMDRLTMVYQRLSNDSVQINGAIPKELQESYDTLNAEWVLVQQLASHLRPSSSYSLQQTVFNKGTSTVKQL